MASIFIDWFHQTLTEAHEAVPPPNAKLTLAVLEKMPGPLSPNMVGALTHFANTVAVQSSPELLGKVMRLFLRRPDLHTTVCVNGMSLADFVVDHFVSLTHDETDGDGDGGGGGGGGDHDHHHHHPPFPLMLVDSVRTSSLKDTILHDPRMLAILQEPRHYTAHEWCCRMVQCPSSRLFDALVPVMEFHFTRNAQGGGDVEWAWEMFTNGSAQDQARHKAWLATTCMPAVLDQTHHPTDSLTPSIILLQMAAYADPDGHVVDPPTWSRLLIDHGWPSILKRHVLSLVMGRHLETDVSPCVDMLCQTDWTLQDELWIQDLAWQALGPGDPGQNPALVHAILRHVLKGPFSPNPRNPRFVLRTLELLNDGFMEPMEGVVELCHQASRRHPVWMASVMACVGEVHIPLLAPVLQGLLRSVHVEVVEEAIKTAGVWRHTAVAPDLAMPLEDLQAASTALIEEHWGDGIKVSTTLYYYSPTQTLNLCLHMLTRGNTVEQQLMALECLHKIRTDDAFARDPWPLPLANALYEVFCTGWYCRGQRVRLKLWHRQVGHVMKDNLDGTYTVRLQGTHDLKVANFDDLVPMDVVVLQAIQTDVKVLILAMWADVANAGVSFSMPHHKLFMHMIVYHPALVDDTLKTALKKLFCTLGDLDGRLFKVYMYRCMKHLSPAMLPGYVYHVLGHIRRVRHEPGHIDAVLRTLDHVPKILSVMVQRQRPGSTPPLWLVRSMIDLNTAGVVALSRSRMSARGVWTRLGQYFQVCTDRPALASLRQKHNFLQAVLYARRIGYYTQTGKEIPIPTSEGPFFETLLQSLAETVVAAANAPAMAAVDTLMSMTITSLFKIYTHNPSLVTPTVARLALQLHTAIQSLSDAQPFTYRKSTFLERDLMQLMLAKATQPPPTVVVSTLKFRQELKRKRQTRSFATQSIVPSMTTDTLRELLEYMDLPLLAVGVQH